MPDSGLGKEYLDGEVICRQGEIGDRMYVIQTGRAMVYREDEGAETPVGVLGAGDICGEMAIFDRAPRSATVRAAGSARVLTLDKRGFLKRVHEDPSLAYRMLQGMSQRVRALNTELSHLRMKGGLPPVHLIVVSQTHPDIYEHLVELFATDPGVQVVIDRRREEQQPIPQSPASERRRGNGLRDDRIVRIECTHDSSHVGHAARASLREDTA